MIYLDKIKYIYVDWVTVDTDMLSDDALNFSAIVQFYFSIITSEENYLGEVPKLLVSSFASCQMLSCQE